MQKQQTCIQHNRVYKSICCSPQCQRFKLLCQQCELNEPKDHKQFIYSLQIAQDRYKAIMKTLRIRIRQFKLRISQKIQGFQNKVPAFQMFDQKLDQIINMIKQRFYHYKQKLKTQFTNELIKKFQQLFQDLDQVQIDPFYDHTSSPHKLSKIFKNDIPYEIEYLESYFNQLQQSKTHKFGWKIEDDKVLRLVTNFQNNLRQLFVQSDQSRILNQQNQLHVFKNMKFYKMLGNLTIQKSDIVCLDQLKQSTDLRSKDSRVRMTFNQKQNIDFKGLAASICYKKQFYIFGLGSQQNLICKFDEQTKCIQKVTQMHTRRKNMSLCLLQNQIYIIGGENQEQGCLRKCQKYNIKQKKVYLINNLNSRSTKHSCINFKGKYIFKFGGISNYRKYDVQLCKNLIQVYSKQIDEWRKIQIMTDFKFQKQYCFNPGILRLKQNQFVIFGGMNQKKQLSNSAFHVTIKYENLQIRQIRVSKAKKSSNASLGIYYNYAHYDKNFQYFFKQNLKGQIILQRYNILKSQWNDIYTLI